MFLSCKDESGGWDFLLLYLLTFLPCYGILLFDALKRNDAK